MTDIKLTDNVELHNLMKTEFHDLVPNFVSKEPGNFIKRLTLTKVQKDLLKSSRVQKNYLTAFITFGDGYFDRPIGATFNWWPYKNVEQRLAIDNIRPNASFALFYKTSNNNISLAFYTRFFVISYYNHFKLRGGKEGSIPLCRKYDAATNPSDKQDKKKKIFKAMSKLRTVHQFHSVTNKQKPKKYGLFIGGVHHQWSDGGEYFPWIKLKDCLNEQNDGIYRPTSWRISSLMRPRRGKPYSTIHGVHETRGCWMLLRNFTWEWPLEDADYDSYMKCYLKYTKSVIANNGSFNAYDPNFLSCLAPLYPSGTNHQRSHKFLWKSRNYTYYRLLNKLAGIKFNDRKAYIPGAGNNCWKRNPVWGSNIFGKSYGVDKLWAEVFLFKREDRFTKDSGDVEKFK